MHVEIMEGAELTSRAVIHIQDNQGAERVFNAVAGHGNGDVIDISSDQPRYASTHLLDNTSKSYIHSSLPFYSYSFIKITIHVQILVFLDKKAGNYN